MMDHRMTMRYAHLAPEALRGSHLHWELRVEAVPSPTALGTSRTALCSDLLHL